MSQGNHCVWKQQLHSGAFGRGYKRTQDLPSGEPASSPGLLWPPAEPPCHGGCCHCHVTASCSCQGRWLMCFLCLLGSISILLPTTRVSTEQNRNSHHRRPSVLSAEVQMKLFVKALLLFLESPCIACFSLPFQHRKVYGFVLWSYILVFVWLEPEFEAPWECSAMSGKVLALPRWKRTW